MFSHIKEQKKKKKKDKMSILALKYSNKSENIEMMI